MKTQKEIFAEVLKRLKIDLSKNDKVIIRKEVGIERNALNEYLNGIVRDNDTAHAIIKIGKECIERRNLILA